ncbi:MAG: COG1361 S-layer family protein [Candidatus Aenigmarchaeota archaeon]|nr:COG1361 S-layer family protein [Candidatus Aenigmarchaeota archaeon]
MNMETRKFIGIFLMAIALMFVNVNAATSATLDVSVLRYEPTPTTPGQYFDVWFKVDNTGGSVATNAVLTIKPKFPFSTDDHPKTMIGILNPLDSTTIKYRIRVDENAIEGMSNLDVTYSANEKTSIIVSKSFDIEIKTSDAQIGINSITTTPKEFLPGQEGLVTLVIKNLADSTLKDINVKLDLTGTTTPFAPIETSTLKNIKTLTGGKSNTITYNVIATPDATSGVYKVPVTVTFSDNVGTNYTSTEIISLIVGGTPQILTNLEPEVTFLSGTTGDVRANIINKGLVDIKYVTIKVKPNGNFELLSNDESYIGNIDSDDFDSATFKIHVMSDFSGELIIPTTVTYMSANNIAFEKTYDLKMRVYTSDEAKNLGLIASSNNTTTIIIVLAIVGYFGYRRYKKRKNRG